MPHALVIAKMVAPDEVVSSGYVHVEVRLQCTQILHRVLDLCQIDPDHPCPIPHGKIVLKRTFVVPEEAPKARDASLLNLCTDFESPFPLSTPGPQSQRTTQAIKGNVNTLSMVLCCPFVVV
eukprot:Opistho-2@67696